jgi:hypothetical protein
MGTGFAENVFDSTHAERALVSSWSNSAESLPEG